MALPTVVKVLLALVPRAVMAVMHTTMIRASMTAYSTAVGPSSRFRKLTTFSANLRMAVLTFCAKNLGRGQKRGEAGARPCAAGLVPTAVASLGRLDGVPICGEGLVGVGAQGRDGRDAHDDDQGQHDRVLDRRRAVLALQEVDDLFRELTHLRVPFL